MSHRSTAFATVKNAAQIRASAIEIAMSLGSPRADAIFCVLPGRQFRNTPLRSADPSSSIAIPRISSTTTTDASIFALLPSFAVYVPAVRSGTTRGRTVLHPRDE